jgi:enterochelin esterase-like enzyme
MHRRHLLQLTASAMAAALPSVAPAGELQILSRPSTVQDLTQALLVRCPQLDRAFLVQVTTPPGLPPGARVPVLYALDGGLGVVGPIAGFLAASGATAPMIVVSIGHQPKDYRLRNGDVLHKPVNRRGTMVGGGGAALEAFLRDELRPYVEANFPVDPARAYLFGHSYAGAFAANVLAHQPTAFAGFLIASPNLPEDPELAQALGRLAGSGQSILLARGETDIAGVEPSVLALKGWLGRPGSGFALTDRVFPGANHASYIPAMLLDALPRLAPPS